MNRGFTLVELLAIILILALLALVAASSVGNIIRDSKENLTDAEISVIKEAAKIWGLENSEDLPDVNECGYLTLKDLKDNGFIDNNIVNPKTGKKFKNDMKIKITSSINKKGKEVFNYEVDSKDVSSCIRVLGPICTPAREDVNALSGSFDIGDKYICEVKPGTKYNFYVLSKEEDGTTNLIMDRNICNDGNPATETNECFIEYNDTEDAANSGPVTAMNYLNQATSNWSNVSNLNITYDDEGKNFTNFKIKGKARLPYYSEVSEYNGNNAYLYDNLHLACWDENWENPIPCSESNEIEGLYIEGIEHISNIYGYWILSSKESEPYYAWILDYGGYFDYYNFIDYYGVRPVINVKL